MSKPSARKKVPEIPLIGEVDEWEEDVIKSILELPKGSDCVLHIDSGGGSVYGALAVTTLIRQRQLHCTALVLGECSSASILVFAACQKRIVTRYSTFLLHPMRWQSDKRVGAQEASQWAKHFEDMERELDVLQEKLLGGAVDQVRAWIRGGHYVTGAQMVAAGLAEMLEI
jgi:ATP-dependent Clp protease, protease subunit